MVEQFISQFRHASPRHELSDPIRVFRLVDGEIQPSHVVQFPGIKTAVYPLRIPAAQFGQRHVEIHFEIFGKMFTIPGMHLVKQGNRGNHDENALGRHQTTQTAISQGQFQARITAMIHTSQIAAAQRIAQFITIKQHGNFALLTQAANHFARKCRLP